LVTFYLQASAWKRTADKSADRRTWRSSCWRRSPWYSGDSNRKRDNYSKTIKDRIQTRCRTLNEDRYKKYSWYSDRPCVARSIGQYITTADECDLRPWMRKIWKNRSPSIRQSCSWLLLVSSNSRWEKLAFVRSSFRSQRTIGVVDETDKD